MSDVTMFFIIATRCDHPRPILEWNLNPRSALRSSGGGASMLAATRETQLRRAANIA
jgi:hypothetical protein